MFKICIYTITKITPLKDGENLNFGSNAAEWDDRTRANKYDSSITRVWTPEVDEKMSVERCHAETKIDFYFFRIFSKNRYIIYSYVNVQSYYVIRICYRSLRQYFTSREHNIRAIGSTADVKHTWCPYVVDSCLSFSHWRDLSYSLTIAIGRREGK